MTRPSWHGSWIVPSLLDGARQSVILTQQRDAMKTELQDPIKETFSYKRHSELTYWHSAHTSSAHTMMVEKNGG